MQNEDLYKQAANHAASYLAELNDHAVNPTATIEELRERLDRPMTYIGTADTQVIDELVADTRDGLMTSTGGRFFGWIIGGALPAAIAADWLTTVWDQNAAASACSPAMAVAEEVCGAWLRNLLMLPDRASFGFVTGCQAAHTTALAAARHSLLKDRGWDVERQGLSGAPPIRLVTSESRHESLRHLTGFGYASPLRHRKASRYRNGQIVCYENRTTTCVTDSRNSISLHVRRKQAIRLASGVLIWA